MSGNNRFVAILFFLLCSHATAQVRINEVLALNAASAYDPDFGRFADFIELYNASADPVDLTGYSITDNPANPAKWRLPSMTLQSDEYLVVWADGFNLVIGEKAYSEYRMGEITITALHANFALSGDGEYVGLYDSAGAVVDERHFGVQSTDIAFGRDPGNPDRWIFFSEVTPGERNSVYGAATLDLAAEPTFSLREGFYSTAQTLRITAPGPDAVVRFTFDGSTPHAASPVFPDSFSVFRTYVIKARVYRNGKLPGPVVTRSYFIEQSPTLPVVSLSGDPGHFFDFDYGILRNAIKEREVPVSVEYFNETGERGFASSAGARVFGSTIYALPQRPIAIRFRADYGQPLIDYPLFEGRNTTTFTSLLLRNGGNDYNLAYFRDGLAVQLAKGSMDIDYQEYKPCVVYINGAYHGVYELRERVDNSTLGQNNAVSPANVDLLEDSLVVVSGGAEDFRDVLRFVRENDLRDDLLYAHVAAKMDVHEFINYMFHKLFIGYRLFDLNNKYWRDRDGGSRWRWVAADMEHAFGQLGGDDYMDNTLHTVSEGTELPEWCTAIFRGLLRNVAFRDAFAQRCAVYLNTDYAPGNTTRKLDSLEQMFLPEMPRHIQKWGSPVTMQVWRGNVDAIRNFLRERPSYFRQHLASQFGLSDSVRLTLERSGEGLILLEGVMLDDAVYSGYHFRNAALRVSAVPKPGYRFSGWAGLPSAGAEISLRLSGDSSLTAVFEADRGSIIPAVISRDTTLVASIGPWYAVGDVRITPGAILRIGQGSTVYMADNASLYVRGGLRIDGSEAEPVRIVSDPGSAGRRPWYNSMPRWGVVAAESASDSIVLQHAHIFGSGYGSDRARQFSTISAFDSDVRIADTHIEDAMQPFFSDGGSVYIGHSSFRTRQTGDLMNITNTTRAIVEYCDLRGNNAPDTDGIDYDGVTGGIIRANRIYDFTAPNSDGIDIGEGSRNLVIEQNIIHDCSDKAVSVGQASTVLLRRNVLFNCAMGVAVKDSNSHAVLDQNTLHGNTLALACYEKNTSRGGGSAEVLNTILAASREATLFRDEKSVLTVRYSLSDGELLPGEGNLHADPLFVNTSVGNFALQPASPCIDAGDPASSKDPDGSRADIGAYYRHNAPPGAAVRINEINYHSSAKYDTGDWIELYNAGPDTVALGGWTLEHDGGIFTFPDGVLIASGRYILLCEDTVRFRRLHAVQVRLLGHSVLRLSNKSATVNLYDSSHTRIHTVRYEDDWPWPPLADGKGATMELEHGRDGGSVSDWRESYVRMGSPGWENSRTPVRDGLYMNEVLASNGTILADEYGEYDDWCEVYNSSHLPRDIGGLYFTDDFSNPRKWQVPLDAPEATTAAPGGFLLLWADEQPEQGPLHADIKLSADGEVLGMYQRRDSGWVRLDSLTFPAQQRNISYGRYPDGSDALTFMFPTPRHSNVPSSVGTPVPQNLNVFPNPFSAQVTIDVGDLPKPYALRVYSPLGITVFECKGERSDSVTIERGLLPAGLYLYSVTDARGAVRTGKLIAR
ncbi:MAG: lamin tail domain-containing protein [Bacteroidia bacterium]|nr:lamin tail domain-containing protein [Bacteroidia bacterium]